MVNDKPLAATERSKIKGKKSSWFMLECYLQNVMLGYAWMLSPGPALSFLEPKTNYRIMAHIKIIIQTLDLGVIDQKQRFELRNPIGYFMIWYHIFKKGLIINMIWHQVKYIILGISSLLQSL